MHDIFYLVICFFVLFATIAIILVTGILYKRHFRQRFRVRDRKISDDSIDLPSMQQQINFLERQMIQQKIQILNYILNIIPADRVITIDEIKKSIIYLQEQLNESRD